MENFQLEGRVLLVVEDEPLVALDILETLAACGAQVISARRETDAMTSVDRHQISAAILDINLGGEDCSAICQYLTQCQIPFLFYTGYTTPPDGWHDVPIINKPAHRAQIVDTVERLCGAHQRAA